MGEIYDRWEARKKPVPGTSTPFKPMFQSRPFVLPKQLARAEQKPDYRGQLERSQKFGYSLSWTQTTPNTAIQPKLTIGAPGNQYEQEADQVASRVVSQINAPMTQMKSQDETLQPEKIEGESLMRKPLVLQQRSQGGEMTACHSLETSISQERGGGQPLAGSVRQKMEKAFGADFSRVKIHSDAKSDNLNKSIQAKAFTTGQDIFFRQGEYSPESRGGQELIAHELTHVVQQNGNKVQRHPVIQRVPGEEQGIEMEAAGLQQMHRLTLPKGRWPAGADMFNATAGVTSLMSAAVSIITTGLLNYDPNYQDGDQKQQATNVAYFATAVAVISGLTWAISAIIAAKDNKKSNKEVRGEVNQVQENVRAVNQKVETLRTQVQQLDGMVKTREPQTSTGSSSQNLPNQLLQEIKELKEKLGQLENDNTVLEQDNQSLRGTVEEQDKRLTAIESMLEKMKGKGSASK